MFVTAFWGFSPCPREDFGFEIDTREGDQLGSFFGLASVGAGLSGAVPYGKLLWRARDGVPLLSWRRGVG